VALQMVQPYHHSATKQQLLVPSRALSLLALSCCQLSTTCGRLTVLVPLELSNAGASGVPKLHLDRHLNVRCLSSPHLRHLIHSGLSERKSYSVVQYILVCQVFLHHSAWSLAFGCTSHDTQTK
jgi:hypothetical protein